MCGEGGERGWREMKKETKGGGERGRDGRERCALCHVLPML